MSKEKNKAKDNDKDKDKDNKPIIKDADYRERELQYVVIQNETDINHLVNINKRLSEENLKFTKELSEMKSGSNLIFRNETEINQLKKNLDRVEKENSKLQDILKQKEKYIIEEIAGLRKGYECEIFRLKSLVEAMNNKSETVSQMEEQIEKQKELIEKLEKEKLLSIQEYEVKGVKREIGMQLKFEDLKKKMQDNLHETRRNVKDLNLDTLEISTKLTILQNHQLNVELEYQAEVINDLMKRNETLNKKLFEMKKDLEIHSEVENKLAEKNRIITKTLENMTKKIRNSETITFENSQFGSMSFVGKSDQSNLEDNSDEKKSHIKINNRIKEFQVITSLEKKIIKLEKTIEINQEDYFNLKTTFSRLSEKLQGYEKKYLGVFNLFEEGLKRLKDDDSLKNMNQIYLNIDSLKNGDYNCFTSDQKYSILVILMKNLIPLINPGDLSQSDFNNKNFDKIKLKYHYQNQNERSNKFLSALKNANRKQNKSNLITSSNSRKQSDIFSEIHTEPSERITKKDPISFLPRLSTNH